MNNTKILALYLPQYYETDYNNDWWGKGYTEWVACKKAKPLFENHYQPRVPMDNHYYDLTNVDEIKWQAEIAKEYGIDGFVIYQYYSANNSDYGVKNGKNATMLLSDPLKLFLEHTDIDIPFCLYWANHSWKKLWFGQEDPTELWSMDYGEKSDWLDFFNYEKKFFHDSRYIKIDNKPLFFIFLTRNFDRIGEFMDYWNELAIKEGFDGVYFIKTIDAHTGDELERFDGVFYREPFYTFAKGFSKFSFVKRVLRTRTVKHLNPILNKRGRGIVGYKCDYDKAWKSVVSRPCYSENRFPGAFADWDNTARKQYNAQILMGASPQKFGKYLSILYKKCNDNKVPYIIINAWNEWAEGAYLEPDQRYGFEYLEQIRKIKNRRETT